MMLCCPNIINNYFQLKFCNLDNHYSNAFKLRLVCHRDLLFFSMASQLSGIFSQKKHFISLNDLCNSLHMSVN